MDNQTLISIIAILALSLGTVAVVAISLHQPRVVIEIIRSCLSAIKAILGR
jgi:ABC-type amino acid transport system permease subunit